MKKKSKTCSTCQHNNLKCWMREGEYCIKYLSCENTNIININGVVETPPDIADDVLLKRFINWIESLGYNFGGGVSMNEDD